MPTTMADVVATLAPDEPDYEQAALLGPDALPYLEELVQSGGAMLAAKATYLISLIPHPTSPTLLLQATQSGRPEVRIAAAAGARNLAAPAASDIVLAGLNDADSGVRKVALKSVPATPPSMPGLGFAEIPAAAATPAPNPALRAKVEELEASDPEPFIRDLSRDVLNTMPS